MSTKLRNSSTTYLQSCVDIIQMVVQRKMFQSSKDELALILYGSLQTANELWDETTNPDCYMHVQVARPLSIADWNLLEYLQNQVAATNIQGDIIDALIVSSNHFHEDLNKKKVFKDKRIMILTDFSCSTEDDEKLETIIAGLSKNGIRVDVITPFSDQDIEESKKDKSKMNGTNGTASNSSMHEDERKTLTKEQQNVCEFLKQVCEQTDGAMYSFEEGKENLYYFKINFIKF